MQNILMHNQLYRPSLYRLTLAEICCMYIMNATKYILDGF